MSRRVLPGVSCAALGQFRDADLIRIGVANSPAPAPRTMLSLTLEQTFELAVLGITMARPLPLDRIADLLRRILSPPLQPTLEVVEIRLEDLARRGLVVMSFCGPERTLVRSVRAGRLYARTLLRMPSPPPGAAHRDLAFMLKVCLLDLLVDDDRPAVIAELRRDLQTTLAAAEEAARRCRATGAYARHWLERQASRLRDDLRWLDGVAAGPSG